MKKKHMHEIKTLRKEAENEKNNLKSVQGGVGGCDEIDE
jgi:hypothetical protein